MTISFLFISASANADALRRRAGLQAPVFGDYVANIVRFFRENERAIR